MDWATANGMDGLRALPADTLATGDGRRPSLAAALVGPVLNFLLRMLACRRAAIGPLTALMLIPISGAIAYSVEIGCWQYMQRAMQNAADTAALAAATNNNSSLVGTDPYYRIEARAAAKQFGFINSGNTTVTSNRVDCPTGTVSGVTCYSATISTKFPLMFSRVIGFNGDSAFGSGRGQSILASAIATTAGGSTGTLPSPCVWTFTDLHTNGSPGADLTGCTVLSSGTMTCNGAGAKAGLKADYAIAVGSTPVNCPKDDANAIHADGASGVTIPADPYAPLASNIPATSCPHTNPSPKGNISGTVEYCGGLSLTANLTITAANTVIVVRNGPLNMNGFTLSTAANASATIIFAGTGTGITGKSNDQGILNIQAPGKDSGSVWKGVAIYQDPSSTAPVDTTIAGAKGQQAWTITGLVYLPKANVTVKGAVNHFAGAPTCMILVTNTLLVDGGGSLLQAPTGCGLAGVTQPTITKTNGILTRQKLVQ